MRSGTRGRVFAFIAGLGAATLLLAGAGYWTVRHALSAELNDRIQARVTMLQEIEHSRGNAALVAAVEQMGQRGMRTLGYCISRDGKHIYGATDTPMLAPGWHEIQIYDLDDSRYETARALTVKLRNGDHLTVIADRDFLTAFDSTLAWIFFGLLAAVVLLAAGGALMLEHYVRGRLLAVNDLAAAIHEEKDLNRRLPVSVRGDEFDRLAAVLNGMLDQIGALLNEVRRVNGYIAHDLRRPLAALLDRLSALKPARGGTAQLRAAQRDVQSLLQLFDAILEIGEHRRLGTVGDPLDLSELARFMAESFQPVAEEAGKQLTVDALPGMTIVGVRHLLAQILVNLIENAIQHTPPRTRIAVRVDRIGDAIELAVADNGRGLKPQPGENPLGLRLVRLIAEAHGATMNIHGFGTGLEVVIAFPASA